MSSEDLFGKLQNADPATGLRAAVALRRLAERVEATHVEAARASGWSWEQIADALGVSRQSAHMKHGKKKETDDV